MNLSMIVSPSLPPPRHYNIGIGNRLIVSFWALGPTASDYKLQPSLDFRSQFIIIFIITSLLLLLLCLCPSKSRIWSAVVAVILSSPNPERNDPLAWPSVSQAPVAKDHRVTCHLTTLSVPDDSMLLWCCVLTCPLLISLYILFSMRFIIL